LRALSNREDLAGIGIPAGDAALRLLGDYADGLLDDPALSDPVALTEAGQSLLELAVLAFGAYRDRIEIGQRRGLRAARLAAVLRCIRIDYADPDLSPQNVARRVGISTRYLHGLLQDTEASFSERVRDLRLAKAFTLLCAGRGSPCSVSEAAYEAGFSDLSYFNRSFRRKYGLTPTAARGRAAGR
jgi:AraC-like DNA-binding protein